MRVISIYQYFQNLQKAATRVMSQKYAGHSNLPIFSKSSKAATKKLRPIYIYTLFDISSQKAKLFDFKAKY